MGKPFLKQNRPAKVKEIYRALKRDHPNMPAGKKARIASAVGRRHLEKSARISPAAIYRAAQARMVMAGGSPTRAVSDWIRNIKVPGVRSSLGPGEKFFAKSKTVSGRVGPDKLLPATTPGGPKRLQKAPLILQRRGLLSGRRVSPKRAIGSFFHRLGKSIRRSGREKGSLSRVILGKYITRAKTPAKAITGAVHRSATIAPGVATSLQKVSRLRKLAMTASDGGGGLPGSAYRNPTPVDRAREVVRRERAAKAPPTVVRGAPAGAGNLANEMRALVPYKEVRDALRGGRTVSPSFLKQLGISSKDVAQFMEKNLQYDRAAAAASKSPAVAPKAPTTVATAPKPTASTKPKAPVAPKPPPAPAPTVTTRVTPPPPPPQPSVKPPAMKIKPGTIKVAPKPSPQHRLRPPGWKPKPKPSATSKVTTKAKGFLGRHAGKLIGAAILAPGIMSFRRDMRGGQPIKVSSQQLRQEDIERVLRFIHSQK